MYSIRASNIFKEAYRDSIVDNPELILTFLLSNNPQESAATSIIHKMNNLVGITEHNIKDTEYFMNTMM